MSSINSAPVAYFDVFPDEGLAGKTVFSFDASNSFDNEDDFEDLIFNWNFEYARNLKKTDVAKILDCSGSIITAIANSSSDGTINLVFNFDIHCGSNWVDGISLDFPNNIVINNWSRIGDATYGSNAGQNCENMNGVFNAATNTLVYGNDYRSLFGCIEASQTWIINIQATNFPINIEYHVYDDGYDGTIVDATGITTISGINDYKMGYIYGESGTYTVKLEVIDTEGASDYITKDIHVSGIDIETISGTTNSAGEYTFYSEVYNQDITVQVIDNYGTPLSNIIVDATSTENNLIVIVSDVSKNYLENPVTFGHHSGDSSDTR